MVGPRWWALGGGPSVVGPRWWALGGGPSECPRCALGAFRHAFPILSDVGAATGVLRYRDRYVGCGCGRWNEFLKNCPAQARCLEWST